MLNLPGTLNLTADRISLVSPPISNGGNVPLSKGPASWLKMPVSRTAFLHGSLYSNLLELRMGLGNREVTSDGQVT